jgi:hypothetical protein
MTHSAPKFGKSLQLEPVPYPRKNTLSTQITNLISDYGWHEILDRMYSIAERENVDPFTSVIWTACVLASEFHRDLDLNNNYKSAEECRKHHFDYGDGGDQ